MCAVAAVTLVLGAVSGATWAVPPALLLLFSAGLAVWLSVWLPPVVARPGPLQQRALVVLLASLLTFFVATSLMASSAREALSAQPTGGSMADPPEGRWVVVTDDEPVEITPGTRAWVEVADGDGSLRARLRVEGTGGSVDETLEVGDAVDLGSLGRLTLIALEPTHDWTGIRVDGCSADFVLTPPVG